MADVRPFRGLRYDETVAGPLSDLICPPFDVIDDTIREGLLARSPLNFVRAELGRGDPGRPETAYADATRYLTTWRRSGALNADPRPAFYVLDHEFDLDGQRLRRRGIFVALRLYAERDGVVLPHEHTFPKAKADRLALLRATRANTSPVFGLVGTWALGTTLDSLTRSAPLVASGELGSQQHELWRVDSPAVIAELRQLVATERVYVADGHHRYETALNYLAEEEAARGPLPPDAPERYVLAYLCALDDPGLRILATHRVVRGGGDALRRAIAASFERMPIDRGALDDVQPGIAFVESGHFEALDLKRDADRSSLPAAWRSLPVALAEEFLMKPAREAGARVLFEHDTGRAIAAAVGGAAAVLLRAIDGATLRRVADRGERLPPKTTYFYPKVPAGLVVRGLDDV